MLVKEVRMKMRISSPLSSSSVWKQAHEAGTESKDLQTVEWALCRLQLLELLHIQSSAAALTSAAQDCAHNSPETPLGSEGEGEAIFLI